jgi:hypothetical protein
MTARRWLLASLMTLVTPFAAAACPPGYADRSVAGPALPPAAIALDIAPARIRAPYDVQIMRETGETLPTFRLMDRFYVEGNANERYVIRITNPTSRRIEAVVSVDGLDVIDGENGDLRKRGYVVPAYGETRIEGFRTSQVDVATFRFSSVSGSYAGQKGKPRNVGVIAVALFEEQAQPEQQIIVGQALPPRPVRRPHREYRDEVDGRSGPAVSATSPDPAGRSPAKADAGGGDSASSWSAPQPADRAAKAAPTVRPAPSAPAGGAGAYTPSSESYGDDEDLPSPPRDALAQRERLGLGTEFGEQRSSAASYTRFVRAPGRPVAIAELRYNDAAGLQALGIAVQPLPDPGEIMTRETADPFPGDRYARPPH